MQRVTVGQCGDRRTKVSGLPLCSSGMGIHRFASALWKNRQLFLATIRSVLGSVERQTKDGLPHIMSHMASESLPSMGQ
eukprot:3836647-Amphidinium_carterae.1